MDGICIYKDEDQQNLGDALNRYEEEDDDDTVDTNLENETFIQILSQITQFNGEIVSDNEISAIYKLSDLIANSEYNYSKLISKNKLFMFLINILKCSLDNVNYTYEIIKCFSILTGKDYQQNSFFMSNFKYIDITIPLLNDHNLARLIIISYCNIFADQPIPCRHFLSKVPPSEICHMCQQYSGDLKMLISLARLIVVCTEYPPEYSEVPINLFKIAKVLVGNKVSMDDLDDDSKELYTDFQLLSLYACNQCILASHDVAKMAAKDNEFIKVVVDILNDFHSIRIAEWCLTIIGHLATEEEFQSSLITNELLYNFFHIDDPSLLRALDRCIRNLNVNGRLLLCEGDFLSEKIEDINHIIEISTFNAKEQMANSLQIVLSHASNQFILDLMQKGFFDTIYCLKDLETKEGTKYFLDICRIVFKAALDSNVEQASAILDLFHDNEILQYIDEIANGEKDDGYLQRHAELVQSAIRNLVQYINENS